MPMITSNTVAKPSPSSKHNERVCVEYSTYHLELFKVSINCDETLGMRTVSIRPFLPSCDKVSPGNFGHRVFPVT